MVPQVVNPQVLVVPAKAPPETSLKKKGACTKCGQCWGSLFVMVVAILCTMTCYLYPVYKSITDPDYFNNRQEPVWTWGTAVSRAKELGHTVSSIGLSLLDESETVGESDGSGLVSERKLKAGRKGRGRNGRAGSATGDASSATSNSNSWTESSEIVLLSNSKPSGGGSDGKYFEKEYCDELDKRGPWRDFCSLRASIGHLDCVDVMDGPTVCVGIKDLKRVVFTVSQHCKLLDPKIPVEIIPVISDYCSGKIHFQGKPRCPCKINSSIVELSSQTPMSHNNSTSTGGARANKVSLNKLDDQAVSRFGGSDGVVSKLTGGFEDAIAFIQQISSWNNTRKGSESFNS